MSEIAVVKLGSNLLTDEAGLNEEMIFTYAAGLSEAYCQQGKSLVVVTSGAVAAGRARAEHNQDFLRTESMSLQQHAALGATAVFRAWEQGFEEFEEKNLLAASIAVTHRQLGGGRIWQRLQNRQEKRSFAQTLRDNCESGIITIINEADAISVSELMKLKCGGDNDGLAAHLSKAIGAESLTLFTEKGGVFDDQKNLIEEVNRHNIREVKKMAAARSVGFEGRGGLIAKIEAAWDAAQHGVEARIAAANLSMTGSWVTRFVVE